MKHLAIKLLLAWGLLGAWGSSACAHEFNIVTGAETGTYIQIGRDLATLVGAPANINIQVLSSNGSVENIRRLRDEKGTRLALVQADVYQAFKDQASQGNAEAARIVNPLRVVLPLYDEEIYLVVRADSPMESIRDIQKQRINIGPLGSGTAMTASTLYRLMFSRPLEEAHITTLGHEEALLKLVRDQTIDVVMVVAGQPTNLFLGMEPGVEKYFKLLKLTDPDLTQIGPTLETYAKGSIQKQSYPHWLTQDVPTLSIKTLLVTYDYSAPIARTSLTAFSKSLCEQFDFLRKEGHPKWQQVNLDLTPLGAGWSYYTPTETELKKCLARPSSRAPRCTLQERIMGFCKGG